MTARSLGSPILAWIDHTIDDTLFRVFRPAGASEQIRMIFFLHDEDESLPLRNAAVERLLEERQFIVVAPVCGPIWSLDVATKLGLPRGYFVERILPAAQKLARADQATGEATPDVPMALLGVGMGGQALLRVALDYPDRYPVIAAIEPTIDFHLHVRAGHSALCEMFGDEEPARQHTAILHVHPLNWPRRLFFCADPMNYPWFDGSDRLRMKLAASGIPFECELEATAEDIQEPYLQMMIRRAIEHCEAGLNSERLRIV